MLYNIKYYSPGLLHWRPYGTLLPAMLLFQQNTELSFPSTLGPRLNTQRFSYSACSPVFALLISLHGRISLGTMAASVSAEEPQLFGRKMLSYGQGDRPGNAASIFRRNGEAVLSAAPCRHCTSVPAQSSQCEVFYHGDIVRDTRYPYRWAGMGRHSGRN